MELQNLFVVGLERLPSLTVGQQLDSLAFDTSSYLCGHWYSFRLLASLSPGLCGPRHGRPRGDLMRLGLPGGEDFDMRPTYVNNQHVKTGSL